MLVLADTHITPTLLQCAVEYFGLASYNNYWWWCGRNIGHILANFFTLNPVKCQVRD
jgi:hypothetical protein